jgi:NAD(P)-dependent dehydrogenase (short-subunit alcohol dehydrogenase family)
VSSEERSIFITGAASGIGRETAKLFAARGFRVGAVDVDEAGLASLAGEIGGERCWTAQLDVRKSSAYADVIARFGLWAGGRLDVLFNCAGILKMSPFDRMSLADHVRTVEVNVIAVLTGIHTAFGLLKATPGAHIVSMGSASGLYGVPDLATYSASKFFIRGLTEALSIEFEKHGITVTDLMPLYVDTPMVRNQSYRAGSLVTFGAKLTPQEIAELVWKAAHAKKVHWKPGALLKALDYLGGVFPFVARPTMKMVDRRKE